jgi:Fic family protein
MPSPIVAAATRLGQALHPRTAGNLADLVRIANTYYSNLIEGHNTRPKDIERALAGDLHHDKARRNLSRGLETRSEYKQMMDYADMPRQGDLDGRGNLSLRALNEFVLWFLRVCLDQVNFMSDLLEIDALAKRLRTYVERRDMLKPEATRLLEEALIRGEFERGEIARITDCLSAARGVC